MESWIFWKKYEYCPQQKHKPMLKKTLQVVVFNQTVIGIPFMVLTYYLFEWRGCAFHGELPTFHWFLLELTVFSLVEELGFYYSHRYFNSIIIQLFSYENYTELTMLMIKIIYSIYSQTSLSLTRWDGF